MDKSEDDQRCGGSEDACSLSRNRSFKSKQLVRSQAIRESQSPPRTSPPAVATDAPEAKTTRNEVLINYREIQPNSNDLKPNLTEAKPNHDGVKLDFSEVKPDYIDAKLDLTYSEAKLDYNDPKLDYSEATAVHNAEVRTVNLMIDESSHTSDELVSSEKISDTSDDCKRMQQVEIQITSGAWDAEPQDQRQRARRWLGQRQLSRDLLSNSPRVACVCGACHACPHCRGRRRRQTCPIKQDSGIACSTDCPDCGPELGGSEARSLDADEPAYCRCPERKEKPKSISLSRTDSDDKSEPTGQDLINFIKETLNKNGRDRITLLKIERELHSLINDTGRCIVRFPVMTSYGRMLVHRCASLFELSHHLDQSNKTSVMVSKSGTSGGRIPCTPFRQWCTTTFLPSPQRASHQPHNAKSILKRATHSLDSSHAGALSAARSKSLEQREREYERVRRRIFSSDNCTSQDESRWPWLSSGPVKLLTPDPARSKLLKVHSLEASAAPTLARGVVSKSHSFGGYGGAEPTVHPARLLSRQGDLASSSWRLSPSSSGYRTLSLHSADSVTPSPTGGASPEPAAAGAVNEGGAVVWAVTDLSAVPAGAVVIHPQTGRALTNPDGSIYHFDPAAPPALCGALYAPTQQHKTEQNCEKRRGRLEKQHSFIDSECECAVSEEYNKCCCECGRQQRSSDKISTQQDQKPDESPPSPCKNHYDQTVDVPANHNAPSEPTANHRAAYDVPTNHTSAYDVSTNQNQAYETADNHVPSYDITTNHRAAYDATTNPKSLQQYDPNQVYSPPPNQRPLFERRHYEPTNHRPESFENQRQYDNLTNQRTGEAANHRPPKLTSQESQEMIYVGQQYVPYRNEEVTSPQAVSHHTYIQPELAMQYSQAKVAPLAIPDPNIRPLSLTNMMFPALPQGYPYLNQCRMDQQMQPAQYQPAMQAAPGDKQLAPSPHAGESTFRIDPSYPYAALDYGACGACAPPAPAPAAPPGDALALQQQHRSFNVPYGQVELQQAYPVSAPLLLPQPYPYQDQLQWQSLQSAMMPIGGKMLLHDLYPIVQYPGMYPQYNVVYPQMVPHSYALPAACAQAEPQRRGSFAGSQRSAKRDSVSGSARTTPLQAQAEDPPPGARGYAATPPVSRQNSNEIAVKIQQIKEQMAKLNTRERDGNNGARGTEWKRRNSGHGILGSYPAGGVNGRPAGRPTNDESQLTSAARAIVNSIRNMHQNKNTYSPRPEQQYQPRADYGPRARRADERPWRGDERPWRGEERPWRGDERPWRGEARARGAPPQYRPQYLLRQMSPGAFCRRSPGPVHPVLNHPRRPHPDTRNPRR